MSRRSLALFAFAVVSPGCVPVTEPVGDVAKAEPDKALVGAWDGPQEFVIDVPEVKGNPKGLMRAVTDDKPDRPDNVRWFFTTTVGKHIYANIVLESEGGKSPPFHNEGEFAKWQKRSEKHYYVFQYKVDAQDLTIDCGSMKAVKKLMADENIESVANLWFDTPSGWLTKYLEKTGPDTIYDGSNKNEYTRAKKK